MRRAAADGGDLDDANVGVPEAAAAAAAGAALAAPGGAVPCFLHTPFEYTTFEQPSFEHLLVVCFFLDWNETANQNIGKLVSPHEKRVGGGVDAHWKK